MLLVYICIEVAYTVFAEMKRDINENNMNCSCLFIISQTNSWVEECNHSITKTMHYKIQYVAYGLWICEQALYYHYKRLTHTAASKIFCNCTNNCLLLTMFKQPIIQALRYNFTIITSSLCLSEANVMNRTKLRKC